MSLIFHQALCLGLLTKDYYNSSNSEEIISASYTNTSGVAWEYTFEDKKILSKYSKWYFSEFNQIRLTNNIGKSDVELNLYYQKDNSITKFATIKSDVSGNNITWPPSRIFKNLLTEDVVLEQSDKLIFKIESFTDAKVWLNPMVFYYGKQSTSYIQTGIYENIIPPDFVLMSPAVPSNRTINSTNGSMLRGVLQSKFDYLENDIRGKLSYVWGGRSYVQLYSNTKLNLDDFNKNFALLSDVTLNRNKINVISTDSVFANWGTKFALLFTNPNGFTLKVTDAEGNEHILMTPEETGWIYTELINIRTSSYDLGEIAMLFNNKVIILGNR